MPPTTIHFTHDQFREIVRILRDPIWDPAPDWIDLTNKEMVRRFAEIETQFKMKEMQLKQEKLEQMKQILG